MILLLSFIYEILSFYLSKKLYIQDGENILDLYIIFHTFINIFLI